MIRAQRETFAGLVQILGMVIGEVGMQIRVTCILDGAGGERERGKGAALIYSHVLAIVFPGFDCPVLPGELSSPLDAVVRHLQAEVRYDSETLSGQQDAPCVIASHSCQVTYALAIKGECTHN